MTGRPILNVVPGYAAGGVLLGCGLPREAVCVACSGDLSAGPLPGLDDLAAFTAARQAYWAPVRQQADEELSLEQLRAAQRRLLEPGWYRLWFGATVQDVLALAFVLALHDAGVPRGGQVWEVLSPDALGDAGSLGALHPDQVDRSEAPWGPLAAPERAQLRALWAAATAPTPEPLNQLVEQHGLPGPIRDTAQALIVRYPEASTGLGRWDAWLLSTFAEEDDAAPQVIGRLYRRVARMGGRDYPSVGYLLDRIRRLVGAEEPLLVRCSPDHVEGHDVVWGCSDAGRQALAGVRRAVMPDDFVGGVGVLDETWVREGTWVRPGQGG